MGIALSSMIYACGDYDSATWSAWSLGARSHLGSSREKKKKKETRKRRKRNSESKNGRVFYEQIQGLASDLAVYITSRVVHASCIEHK
jgi:hypothetical protein